MDGWKVGWLEGWKVQGDLLFPLFPDTSTELSAAKRSVCNCIRTTIPSRPVRPGPIDDDDDDEGSNVKWQNAARLKVQHRRRSTIDQPGFTSKVKDYNPLKKMRLF